MAGPVAKKQKTASKSQESSEPRITDPRFANIQSDPRYRLPGRKDKVKLDKRFKRALEDEDFTRRAKVDRYGRPLASDAERKRLKRRYEFEDDEDEGDEPDDDDEVQKELKKFDPLREARDDGSASSSDESTSDEDSDEEEADLDEEVGVGATQNTDIPTGEVTSRIAIVNLDWDNIRAADLMAVFASFLPSTGSLLKVSIYPSEFGKERLEREEMEGPPKDIFAADVHPESSGTEDEDEEDDEHIKKSILQADDGADFDSAALRKYQLERLRYYYCILTFSSPSVAKHIYDAVDGTEYLRTANFFDLRFVPDETDFSTDTPKEECTSLPGDYKPNPFVTDALQHSKVKLTWDAEDSGRKETIARAFKGGRKEIEENDLKAYLGSDSSEDEDEGKDEKEGGGGEVSKKEAERQRMRALLGLAPEPVKKSKDKQKGPVGDMQVTFTSGLMKEEDEGGKKKKKRSVFENSPEPEETTVEKYIRKERERKQKRKEKMKGTKDVGEDDAKATNQDTNVVHDDDNDNAEGGGGDDLGFDDPFFADDAAEPSAKSDKALSNKMRKEERLKKRAEREAEEEIERKQRAELELLMADDLARTGGDGKDGTRIRHFDMKEIERAEKQARKKGKKAHKRNKQGDQTGAVDDDFKLDTSDPRFARLFSSHEYAIDPTNPKFKGTKGMKALLEEGRNRKQGKNKGYGSLESTGEVRRKEKGAAAAAASSSEADVKSLVEKIKKQSKK
ncbi:pre-rRNA-processing protein esf1 [Rhinocladiella similis]